MKANIKSVLTGIMLWAFLISLSACGKESMHQDYASILDVSDDGVSFLNLNSMESVLSENLQYDEVELKILLHMLEEEKLARDVYIALYEKWGSQVFSRISVAESNHMNAVKYLLQSYGTEFSQVADTGKFSLQEFEKLYEKLVNEGSLSLEAAFKAGALIEEMDIKDLTEALANVSNENITLVFSNLKRGSRNHLRAFNRQLVNLGSGYSPVYIGQAEFDQIVNTPNETGNQHQVRGNKRHGKRYGAS